MAEGEGGKPLTQGWRESPGPRGLRETLVLCLKGFCMGSADVIPGVSGGTMALILGIYAKLVAAIRSIDAAFFSRLVRLDLGGALAESHLRFLLPLLAGILAAVLTMARVMHHLMVNHPIQTWALFFGLIAASILVVGRRASPLTPFSLVLVVLGAAASYFIVGLIPVTTPEAWWFVFLSGALAICAMILPGISGAFILLLLSKYEFITGALKNPFSDSNLLVLAVFAVGCAVGLASFSRLLDHFLRSRRSQTLALLTGFMIGAMRKIWPWKEVLEYERIGSKLVAVVEKNVLPDPQVPGFWIAVALMAVGFLAVVVLERVSGDSS